MVGYVQDETGPLGTGLLGCPLGTGLLGFPQSEAGPLRSGLAEFLQVGARQLETGLAEAGVVGTGLTGQLQTEPLEMTVDVVYQN